MSEIELLGRTIKKGLSMKFCKEKGILPSTFKAEFNNPIFDNWDFLLKIVNMGVTKGDPFTEEENAFIIVATAFIIIFSDKKKDFLPVSSVESTPQNLPSSKPLL